MTHLLSSRPFLLCVCVSLSSFLIKTMYPKVQIRAAKYLTMAQITQFIIGNSLSLCVFYLGETCTNRASLFTLTFMVAYVSFLVTLFVAFANKKYKIKKT
jgi:hypothetical protein